MAGSHQIGETNGYETNRERPTAWPFRDWVIDCFNRDMPYDEFVRSQVAGDSYGEPMGTGFLVAGLSISSKVRTLNWGLFSE